MLAKTCARKAAPKRYAGLAPGWVRCPCGSALLTAHAAFRLWAFAWRTRRAVKGGDRALRDDVTRGQPTRLRLAAARDMPADSRSSCPADSTAVGREHGYARPAAVYQVLIHDWPVRYQEKSTFRPEIANSRDALLFVGRERSASTDVRVSAGVPPKSRPARPNTAPATGASEFALVRTRAPFRARARSRACSTAPEPAQPLPNPARSTTKAERQATLATSRCAGRAPPHSESPTARSSPSPRGRPAPFWRRSRSTAPRHRRTRGR
jgi:hypothetical protein